MSRTRGVSLRTQILLIFLGAAILPLGIVGLWLTSSAVRSGENLLRSHLSESADRFAAAAASRWAYRQAQAIPDRELRLGWPPLLQSQ